jgi:DNA-binding NarL/FixJ family response regulator
LAVPAQTTRTLIVESQKLFAKALALVLMVDTSIDVVGDADRLSESLVRELRPDLILIDIDGGEVDLAPAIRMSRSICPNVKICAFSMHLQVEVMQRCLNAGADGYLVKDAAPSDFLRAVKIIAAGESYVDARIAGRLLSRRVTSSRSSDPCDLSSRELEVVSLIVAGMSNKEISYSLSLSEKTVKNHVSRIFSKFNCTARTQAAVFAIRSGLV